MGLETENPLEFLAQAKAAVFEYRGITEGLSTQQEAEKQAAKALEQLRRETAEKTEKTIRARSEEIAATYDRQLQQIDAKLKKTQAQRDKAKSQGIKGRIAAETEPLHTENKELKRQLAAILKKDGAPGFCAGDLFYTLFRPSGIREIFGLLLAFLLLFAVLPIGVYWFIPRHSSLHLILIYLADIFVFGGLYVLIGNRTNGKHAGALRQGREIKNRIRSNKRKIRGIARSIRTDSNEAGYNLEEFDDELARAQQDRTDIISRKQSAQNTFETVTKNIIMDEIETAARPQLEGLSAALSEASRLRSELESREKDAAVSLSAKFEQYLGKSHMNERDIDAIAAMLERQEAGSIIDAVTKLEQPENLRA